MKGLLNLANLGFLAGMVLLMGATSQVQAGNSIRCDFCSLPQMRERAKFAGTGIHYIVSIPEGRVRGFEVIGAEVELVSVPAEIQGAATGLKEIYVKSGGTMSASFPIRSDDLGVVGLGGASPYDIVNNFDLRSRVGDRLARGSIPNFNTYVNQLLQAALAMAGAASGTTLDLVVTFPGGGEVTYRLTIGQASAQYVKNSARNEDGQAIPEANTREYAGTWRGDHLGRVIEQLHYIGAQFSGGGSGGVSCSWNGETLHCILSHH